MTKILYNFFYILFYRIKYSITMLFQPKTKFYTFEKGMEIKIDESIQYESITIKNGELIDIGPMFRNIVLRQEIGPILGDIIHKQKWHQEQRIKSKIY